MSEPRKVLVFISSGRDSSYLYIAYGGSCGGRGEEMKEMRKGRER